MDPKHSVIKGVHYNWNFKWLVGFNNQKMKIKFKNMKT